MSQLTMNKKWLKYKKMVIPKSASPTQIETEKRDFYAGGLTIIETLIVVSDIYPEEKATDKLDSLYKEIIDFLKEQAEKHDESVH